MGFYEEASSKFDRLRAMVTKGQQTWDLSPKDVQAIQMAVDVLELLVPAVRPHQAHLDIYDVDDQETPKMLCVGADDEHYGETAFECFVSAGAALRSLKAN